MDEHLVTFVQGLHLCWPVLEGPEPETIEIRHRDDASQDSLVSTVGDDADADERGHCSLQRKKMTTRRPRT